LTVDTVADASNKALERSLGDEEVGDLLVALDLSECNCARSPPLLLLHATFSRSSLLDSLLCLQAAAFPNLGGLSALLGHEVSLSVLGALGIRNLLTGDLLSGHLVKVVEL